VFYFAVARGEPCTRFFRVIVKRAHPACVGDFTLLIDDVDSFGPRGVGVVRGVGHVVDAEGKRILLPHDEIVGDSDTLPKSFRLGVANIFFHVGLHLPLVGGMRFAHVDGEEVRVIFVVVVNLYDVADLATKWRSSIAAENDHQRAAADSFANAELIFSVEREQRRVGSIVTGMQLASMHVRQRIAKHHEGVLRATRHHGEGGETCEQEDAESNGEPYRHSFH
jgi:hypothetical protein